MSAFPLPADGDDASLRRALRDRETRYRALFEAIDDGFCIIEFVEGPEGPLSDYVHIEANSGYERHTGIPDIVGKSVYEIAPSEARDWVALYRGVLHSGTPLRFEREFVDAGRFIEVSAARVEPAELNQVSVLFRDITERKTAEAALLDSEAVARENIQRVKLALAAGAIIGTWFWDVPSDHFTADEAFAEAFGLDRGTGREGLTYDKIVESVHPDDRAALGQAVRRALARGGDYAHQYRTMRADGRYYWLEANGRVDTDAEGRPKLFSGVLIDIDQRRAVEAERDRATEELRRLNETLEQRVAAQTAALMSQEEALRQAQKMEAVGQLTGGIAHDFNNLLAAISGSLDLLDRRLSEGRSEGLDRYVEVARGATTRAAALTHRLLAFSRRQTLDPQPTDPVALVAGMEELVRRTVGPQISIRSEAAVGTWPVRVDRNQLENALLNLCINARDAMPEGGEIAIRLTNCALAGTEAERLELAAGDYVVFEVADSGAGIAPDILARVLEPFFTTKPMGQGTGLGLSMIYGFMRQSGGQIELASDGDGTRVRLYVPRTHAGAAPAAAPSAPVQPVRPAGGRILLVDDEVLVRMMLAETLGDLGMTVLEAGNGPDALGILRADDRIDLLVTDIGLPRGMNGHQLATAARALRPDLGIIFVTGYDETAVLGAQPPADRTHVMTKPVDLDALTRKVQELVASAGLVPGPLSRPV